MKQIDSEAFENNTHHCDEMKTIAKVYVSNCKGSVLTVHHILPDLKLRKIFPTILPEERVQVLLSEKVTWKHKIQDSAMENTVSLSNF